MKHSFIGDVALVLGPMEALDVFLKTTLVEKSLVTEGAVQP